MLAKKNQQSKDIWASIARMEAEIAMHYAFLQFMAEEGAAEQLNVTNQAEELETIRN